MDGATSQAEHDAVTPRTLLRGEHRDREIGLALEHGRHEGGGVDCGVAEVRVEEEQQPGGLAVGVAHRGDRRTRLHRRRLAPVLGVADDDGARCAGHVRRVVGGPVVDDDDEVDVGDGARRADGGSDALGLVLGGQDRGDAT